MFNKNVNGIINVSPRLETLILSGAKNNAFGIRIADLIALAKSAVVSPVLKIQSTTTGTFVEYTLIKHKPVSGGYLFYFIGPDIMTLTYTNSTGKYTAEVSEIGSSSTPLDIEALDLSTVPGTYLTNEETNANPITGAMIDAYTNGNDYVFKTGNEYFHITQVRKSGNDLYIQLAYSAGSQIRTKNFKIKNFETEHTRQLGGLGTSIKTLGAILDISAITLGASYTHAQLEEDPDLLDAALMLSGVRADDVIQYDNDYYHVDNITETEVSEVKNLVIKAHSGDDFITATLEDYEGDVALATSTASPYGTAATKDYTPNVAPNDTGLVESRAVYSAINTALSSVYTPRGDIACADLTAALLIAANVGSIYETSDSGTTSDLFLQGAGVVISQGANVGVIQTGPNTYKFNLMADAFDLHEYQKKALTTPLTINGVQKTTVEGVLATLADDSVSVTADGVKTCQELLNALFALVDVTKIRLDSKLNIDYGTGNVVVRFTENANNDYIRMGSVSDALTEKFRLEMVTLSASGSTWLRGAVGSNGTTVTNTAANVINTGWKFEFIY